MLTGFVKNLNRYIQVYNDWVTKAGLYSYLNSDMTNIYHRNWIVSSVWIHLKQGTDDRMNANVWLAE